MLAWLLAGVVVFAALHLFYAATWRRLFAPAALELAWFMGSRRAILVTQAVLFAVAFVGGLRPVPARRRAVEAGSFAAGLVAAMATAFFVLGPERLLVGPARLWPVALLSGGLLMLAPVALGAALAGWLRPLVSSR